MRLFLSICTQLKKGYVFQTNFMPSCVTKFTMKKTLPNCGKEKGNDTIYLKVKENRLTDYCAVQITNDNKSVIKETVEVVAPARISAEKRKKFGK